MTINTPAKTVEITISMLNLFIREILRLEVILSFITFITIPRMFLPDTAEDTLKLISEDVTMTIYGIIMAIEVRIRIQLMTTQCN